MNRIKSRECAMPFLRAILALPLFIDLLIRLPAVPSLIVIPLSFSFSQDYSKSKHFSRIAEKSSQTRNAAILNINDFTFWQQGHGRGAYRPTNSGDGGVYPRRTAWVIFADGFVWSATCYLDSSYATPALPQLIRTGGSTYNVGNEIGWIEGTGSNAERIGASDVRARIYRIRRDWTMMTADELRLDAAENFQITPAQVTNADMQAVFARYAIDWDEWPVQYGAPYIERNGIPGYQKPPPFAGNFTVDSLINGNYDEPGLAGADKDFPANQIIWTVFNDLNRGNMILFAGSEPMGLEMQLTLWGYNQPGALGSLFFKRLRMINKGGADVGGGVKGFLHLDSIFVGLWADPDLGAFGDDLVGCDTVLKIGYVYNGRDEDPEFQKFRLSPPSVGYTLLAGPRVPGTISDTAIFNFSRKYGYKNLSMTSFWPKGSGSAIGDPPFNYEGALRWWRLLQGYVPDPSTSPWRLYPSPPGEAPTKFPMAGDPVTQTGFLDGLGTYYSLPPGDRRMAVNCGPFRLSPLDTQEVVIATVGGMGSDRLSSITVMKANVRMARIAYESLFTTPRPPRLPQVRVAELNEEIVLEWGSNHERVRATEETIIGGVYEFEGYHVYQLPPSRYGQQQPVLIATFDRENGVTSIVDKHFDPSIPAFLNVVIQRGSDSGIRRSVAITRDAFTGDRLRNGTEYVFGITTYNHSAIISPHALESEMVTVRVKPHIPFGVSGLPVYGQTLPVSQTAGAGTGAVTATVINPLASTGDFYEVSFDSTAGTLRWTLRNLSQQTLILTDQPLHTGSDDPPIVEGGIMLTVSGAHTSGDVYRYATVTLDSSLTAQKMSAERINVFPNPVAAESFVTFNNLPHKAVITIYNLAGHLVRTLRKDGPSPFLEWDLNNEHRRQVGSGIYLCRIELPDLDQTRVLKIAVVQQQLYPTMR